MPVLVGARAAAVGLLPRQRRRVPIDHPRRPEPAQNPMAHDANDHHAPRAQAGARYALATKRAVHACAHHGARPPASTGARHLRARVGGWRGADHARESMGQPCMQALSMAPRLSFPHRCGSRPRIPPRFACLSTCGLWGSTASCSRHVATAWTRTGRGKLSWWALDCLWIASGLPLDCLLIAY